MTIVGAKRVGFGTSRRRSLIVLALVLAVPLLFLTPVGLGRSTLDVHGTASPNALAPVAPSGPTTAPPPIPGFRAPTVDPSPRWINISNPEDTPLGSFGGGMAYDPMDNETVYFGGCAEYLCFENQTWVFAHGFWTNVTNPADAPPASWYPSMDYDANMGGVLLFGGENNLDVYTNTTWLFKGGIWTNLTWVSTTDPPARIGASMTFDPEPEENGSVLWGGLLAETDEYSSDTWIWEGWSGWVPLSTSISPPASGFIPMAYDPADQSIVLFGAGEAASTWELYSGQWWAVAPSGQVPAFRVSDEMVYDPSLSALILFGGAYSLVEYSDTWEFANGKWTEFSAPGPSGRDSSGLALDSSGQVPVLFGGENLTVYALNETWVFEPPLSAALTATPNPTEAHSPVTFTATASGGTAPYSAVFDFGDNTSETVTSSSPTLDATHAYPAPGRFATSVKITDEVGVSSSAGGPTLAISATPVVSASARPATTDVGKAVAFSGTTSPAGTPPVNYTWTFGDGTSGYGANVSHTYSTAGSYPVNVTAVDGLGGRSTTTISVAVNPAPSAAISPNLTSAAPGAAVLFSSAVSGGTGPFSYSWNFGDGTMSNFAAPVHVFSGSGTYTVQVWVNDSVGDSAHQSLTYSVSASSSSSGPLSSVPLWFWAGVAAIAAVAVLGTVLLLRRRRTSGPPP